jgi:enoyl-CoA hydratase/3-hydroxyacyl-CoA dehydrogenase
MHGELGDAYRPCPLIVSKVEKEEIGKKSGKGFYDYDDGGPNIPGDVVRESVQHRLVAVTVPKDRESRPDGPDADRLSIRYPRASTRPGSGPR